jgi:hypothetical protein
VNLFSTDVVNDLPQEVVKQKPIYPGRKKGETPLIQQRIAELLSLAGRELTAYEVVIGYYRKFDEVIKKQDVYTSITAMIKDGKAQRVEAGLYKAA